MGFLKEGINEERAKEMAKTKEKEMREARETEAEVAHNAAYNKFHQEFILPLFEESVKDLAESEDKVNALVYTSPADIEKLIGSEQKEVTAVLAITIPSTKERLLVYTKKKDTPNFELKFKSPNYTSMQPKIYSVNKVDADTISNEILITYMMLAK